MRRDKRTEIESKSEREHTKEKQKKSEQRKNANETVVFRRKRNYKEANPRDADSMVVENVPRFHSHSLVPLSSLFFPVSVSTPLSPGFYSAIILRIRAPAIRSYAFHCETFSINYETICTPTRALKVSGKQLT